MGRGFRIHMAVAAINPQLPGMLSVAIGDWLFGSVPDVGRLRGSPVIQQGHEINRHDEDQRAGQRSGTIEPGG